MPAPLLAALQRGRVLVLALAGALAGCFTVTSSSSVTPKELTAQAHAALATPMRQAEVHERLGEPWISSDRWRVEVYRKTGNYRELLVTFGLLPFPLPAPIPLPKEDLTGYILVSYSAAGVVEGVDTAVSKYPQAPLAHLQVGAFAFMEKEPPADSRTRTALQALIVSHERFAATGRRTDACTVLVGCAQMGCGSSAPIDIQLDDDASTKVPMGALGSGGRFPLVPLTPEPGAHTLHVSVQGKADWGEVSTSFTCAASELQYLMPAVRVLRTHRRENLFWPQSRLEGTVQVQNTVPAEIELSGVLLWTNGRWLDER